MGGKKDIVIREGLEFAAYLIAKDVIIRFLERGDQAIKALGRLCLIVVQQHRFFLEVDFGSLYEEHGIEVVPVRDSEVTMYTLIHGLGKQIDRRSHPLLEGFPKLSIIKAKDYLRLLESQIDPKEPFLGEFMLQMGQEEGGEEEKEEEEGEDEVEEETTGQEGGGEEEEEETAGQEGGGEEEEEETRGQEGGGEEKEVEEKTTGQESQLNKVDKFYPRASTSLERRLLDLIESAGDEIKEGNYYVREYLRVGCAAVENSLEDHYAKLVVIETRSALLTSYLQGCCEEKGVRYIYVSRGALSTVIPERLGEDRSSCVVIFKNDIPTGILAEIDKLMRAATF